MAQAVVGRDLRQRLAQMVQLRARIGQAGMRGGDDLDLRLQEFARNPAFGGGLGRLEEGLRHVARDQLGLGVDQEILFFDSERVVARHAQCDIRTGTGIEARMLRVTPPRMNSRKREWP